MRDGVFDRRVGHHADELAAADAPDRIVAHKMRARAGRDLTQHFVAAAMAEQIIDQLEAVEIDIGKRPRQRFVALHGNGFLDAAPVQRAGQRIVLGEKAQTLDGFRTFGGVPCNEPSIQPFERIALSR